ncbi:zf-TFIIB domain-containing protein [Planosporangium sp. 12N6]|uniref:TFIIB-type zinc ribbon-containing protein n=1 Tax=Planosporangium spinosum TaxID=3402278 RepID=UPI003CEC22A3
MQMTCPKCMGQMRQYERSGVTIDQCTECRGIFLDRGELERLVDAETSWHRGQAHQPPPQPQPYAQPHRYRDYDSDEYPVYGQHGHGHYGHKKRRGFLEELFD